MLTGTPLDYQELRNISPEAARRAVLQVLRSLDGNVAKTARALNTSRPTVYKAMAKKAAGSLADAARAPHQVPNKTPKWLEAKVVKLKQRTGYGPIRLHEELLDTEKIDLSEHTIRHIVARNKKVKRRRHKPHKKGERPFVDWYKAKAFEVVQMDLKYVVDQKALSTAQIDHIYAHQLPLYQWSALDVNSRFKLIAYSKEKSWTNGLTWYLWVTAWLRSHGVTAKIVYTVDRGEEFGGKSWLKIIELRKLLSGFGCALIQNRPKSPQENAHLERSHRTDDDEFYIPRILSIPDNQAWFGEAFNYLYYYNVVRKHSSLNRKSPYQHLMEHAPSLDAKIKFLPPLFLDKVSISLGPWSGYHVLAHHQMGSRASYLRLVRFFGQEKLACALSISSCKRRAKGMGFSVFIFSTWGQGSRSTILRKT